MHALLITLSLLAAAAAVILSLRRAELAAVAAALAMLGAFFTGNQLTAGTLWFWLVALAIAAGITVMLPDAVRESRAGMAYFVIAAAAGTLIGLGVWNSLAAIPAGAVAGAALSSVAFGATPQGKALGFPSKKYFNYALAKGLPAAVVISAVAISTFYIIIC